MLNKYIKKATLITSQTMGENNTFLQVGRAQCGVEDADFAEADLPVVMGHSRSRCSSIRMFGSWPSLRATGVLHSGPTR